MMTATGIVDLVLRDKDTLEEISRTTHTNLVLDSMFRAMMRGEKFGYAMIVIGTVTTPMFRSNDLVSGRTTYAAGVNESTTPSPQFFDANGSIPAYTQFKQRFNPPITGVTRTITNVALLRDGLDNPFYINYLISNNNTNLYTFTDVTPIAGFVLSVPCTQTDTQVLDVYYRIQWILPVNNSIKAYHQYRIAKYYSSLYDYAYPDAVYTSAFNMPQNSSRISASVAYRPDGLSYAYWSFLQSGELAAYTKSTDSRLFKLKFAWSVGLSSDIGKIYGTYMFGGGTGSLRAYGSVTGIATGYNGGSRIQPVHNHNSSATVPFIDVNTLANGSGSVIPSEVVGGWTSVSKYPEMFKVDIVNGGDVGTSTYRVKVRRHLGFYDNTYQNRFEVVPYYTAENSLQNHTNMDTHDVVYTGTTPEMYDLADRYDIDTLITANATGVTKANIVNGIFQSWDANTTPALPVTALTDFKYDPITKLIWVACANTGLYKINADAPYTVVHISTPPSPADATKCYAVDIGYGGSIFAVFAGALCQSADAGTSWIAYHPGSTPAFNVPGISDNNWSTVRSIRADPKSPLNQLLITRHYTTTVTPGVQSVWWSTAAPNIGTTAQYWRVLFQNNTGYSTTPRLTQMQFKDGTGGTISGSGTSISSTTSTVPANAFDSSGAIYWESSSTRESLAFWVGYNFNTPVNVQQVSFNTFGSSASDSSVLGTLQSSADGIIWHTSAYMGTSSGVIADSRGFNWSPGTAYNLVALSSWPLSSTGPSLPQRQWRNAVSAAPYSTHFIGYRTNCASFMAQFGSTIVRDNVSSSAVYSNNREQFTSIYYDNDPITGKLACVQFQGCDIDNNSGVSRTVSYLKSELGEHLHGPFFQPNWINYTTKSASGSSMVLFFSGGLTGRFVYMGKGIVTFLRAPGYNQPNKYGTLITGQILLNSSTIDGGTASSAVWDSYGWNGSAWALGNSGVKVTHTDDQLLLNGINVKFTNALIGTSFAAADYYNFGVCEGVWKDNATTVSGNYSYFFKPTIPNVTSFSTPTVQLISGPTGPCIVMETTRGCATTNSGLQPVGMKQCTAFMKQIVFGDFEIQFTMPTPINPGMIIGLLPANMVTQNPTDLSIDSDSYNLGGRANTNATTKNKGSSTTFNTSQSITAGKVFTLKRAAGVVTYSVGGTVFYTVPGTDDTLAYRPYVTQLYGNDLAYVDMATVNIISNGTAYATLCGNSSNTTGVFDPNFYAADDGSTSTFNISLNGTPVVAKYITYATTSLGINEILIDGRSGIVFFNPADAGKTITGSFTQINN